MFNKVMFGRVIKNSVEIDVPQRKKVANVNSRFLAPINSQKSGI